MARRKILCKVNTKWAKWTFYIDGSCMTENNDDPIYWKLAHSDLGPIWLYRYHDVSVWQTDWNSEDEDENMIAKAINNALIELETDNMLKGKFNAKS